MGVPPLKLGPPYEKIIFGIPIERDIILVNFVFRKLDISACYLPIFMIKHTIEQSV